VVVAGDLVALPIRSVAVAVVAVAVAVLLVAVAVLLVAVAVLLVAVAVPSVAIPVVRAPPADRERPLGGVSIPVAAQLMPVPVFSGTITVQQ
jgi:hypothetical protein